MLVAFGLRAAQTDHGNISQRLLFDLFGSVCFDLNVSQQIALQVTQIFYHHLGSTKVGAYGG